MIYLLFAFIIFLGHLSVVTVNVISNFTILFLYHRFLDRWIATKIINNNQSILTVPDPHQSDTIQN